MVAHVPIPSRLGPRHPPDAGYRFAFLPDKHLRGPRHGRHPALESRTHRQGGYPVGLLPGEAPLFVGFQGTGGEHLAVLAGADSAVAALERDLSSTWLSGW